MTALTQETTNAAPDGSRGGAGRPEPRDTVDGLKLRAQALGRSGDVEAAEAALRQVLEIRPDDVEALAMQAIIDSESGRHALAIQRGLRAAQSTAWASPAICENLALFVRRAAARWESARVLRKSLPILARRPPAPRIGEAPRGAYDVIVLCPGPAAATSRFEEVFSLLRTGAGRIVRLHRAGLARERVRESLERASSDLLVFVNAEDLPLEAFTALPCLLEESGSCDWAYAQVTSIDERPSDGTSAYAQYRRQRAALGGLPCADFALFERPDVTGGVVAIRRAALARIAERLPDLPFSVRAVAIHAALESSPAVLAAEAVARPASGFERDRAAAAPLLTIAQKALLDDAARNTNAPMPGEWGLIAWSLVATRGVAQNVGARHWQRLGETAESLERQFAADGPRRGGVNLVGMPLGMFGLAQSMRAFVHAADLAAVTSCVGDLGMNLNPAQSDLSLLDRLRDRLPYRTGIVYANPDILSKCWPAQLREPGRYRIGYWFWEFDRLPEEWAYAFDLVDEIWVATEFVRAAVARSTGKPVVLMPHPIEVGLPAPHARPSLGLDEGRFWFLVSFDFNSSVERKNPYAAIRAFQAAFGDRSARVGLFIKSINGGRHPAKLAALREAVAGDGRIVLRDEAMPRDVVLALLNAADCYVSLHRSEGMGLGLAESMSLGKPVIGTAYSGNLDFMTEDNSCLVGHSLVPVNPGEYIYSASNAFRWAEADVEHAARCMRRLVDDPHFRRSIGRRASADIRARFDPRSIGQRMRARLAEVDAL